MRCASRSRSRCSGSLNRRWDSVNFPCAASIACAANGASLPWPGTSGGSSPSSRPDTAEAPRPSGREGPGNADIRPFNRFLRPIQRQASPQPAKIILGNQPRPQSDRLLEPLLGLHAGFTDLDPRRRRTMGTDSGDSRFAAARIRPASRDWKRAAPHPLEWLRIEWPEGEKEPTKYWLSTLPEDTPIYVLVDTAKLRWRIERDYEELKSELGLAHFEGRSWRGFHHHAALCIAAYGFLIRER